MNELRLDSNIEDKLYHYGVKGMRWGVRRDRREALQARKSRKIEAKARKAEIKSKRKAIERELTEKLEADYNNPDTGLKKALWKSYVIAGVNGMSYTYARHLGATRGKAIAVSLISGAFGAKPYIELKARKEAKKLYS